jgi:hypothetical protein
VITVVTNLVDGNNVLAIEFLSANPKPKTDFSLRVFSQFSSMPAHSCAGININKTKKRSHIFSKLLFSTNHTGRQNVDQKLLKGHDVNQRHTNITLTLNLLLLLLVLISIYAVSKINLKEYTGFLIHIQTVIYNIPL